VEPDTSGYEASVIQGKVSVRAVWQADITLDGVRVPAASRLPTARSFKDTGRVLASTRSSCAFAALGHGVAVYDAALSYSQQRHQFGKPLARFQLVQERLVKMLAEVVGMQLYCLQVGRLVEQGKASDTIASLAKLNQHAQGAPGDPRGPRPARRQRDPAREPRHPPPDGHRGDSHL